MKTKAQIVQELLDKKAIDAEDATILLMADSPTPQVFIYPQFPAWPLPYPVYPMGPFVTYSSAGNALISTHPFETIFGQS